MNLANLLSIILVGASAAAIVKKLAQTGSPAPKQAAPASPVVGAIQEALEQHQGEDTPMVHAFESLLEQETQHEEGLASNLGIHA